MLILLTLQCVIEGETANNFTLMITKSLMQQQKLTQEKTIDHPICFSAKGASFFQSYRIIVITQLKEKYFLYMMGQHYMAHRTNLDVQALSNLPMAARLEELLQSLPSYFSSSLK